ncbi:GGDEF domain-containing protein [Thaumasiovibrio subtropicus]|uniref:GGDEF domain-containing protein n=1 Tax=Thaumasiovibrio subtropicus TaxID=1891207 RepID=UPI00131DF3E0|nr:GGDEF domain-containing protein [Thaumasiovibrio subtropicus]
MKKDTTENPDNNVTSEMLLSQAIDSAEKGLLHQSEQALSTFSQRCSFPRDIDVACNSYIKIYHHYCDHSFYSHALEILNNIIDIAAQYGRIDYYATAVIGMGNLCEIYGAPEKALKFYGRIRDLESNLTDQSIALKNNLHILSCNIALNKIRNAKRQLEHCQTLTKDCSRPIYFNSLLYYEAILSRLDGEKQQALISLSQIAKKASYFESIWLYLEAKREVANCLIEEGRAELAQVVMLQCIKYANWYGNRNTLRRMLTTLSRAQEASGNYRAALDVEKHIHPLEMQIITKIPIGDLGGYCLRRLHRCEIQIKLSLSEQQNAKLLEQSLAQRNRLNELKRETLIDPLTSLYNRRWLTEEFERLAQSPAVSIILIDIDHFKLINDNFSHLTGDNVLRQVASIIRHQFEPYACCRYGGEEFLIVAEDNNLDHLLNLAEQCRLAIEQAPWQHIVSQSEITISGGIAMRHSNESLMSLVRRSDLALYQAKQSGRNQIKVDGEVVSESYSGL